MKEYRGLQYPELSDLFKGGSAIRGLPCYLPTVHVYQGELGIDTGKNGEGMTEEELEKLCKETIDKFLDSQK